jgi:drug/metabolite transporter (DMT)-like permease
VNAAAGGGENRSPLLRAVGLTLAASFLLNLEALIVKLVGPAVPVSMIVAMRSLAQLAWVAPALARSGPDLFRTRHLWLHLLRGLLSLLSWGAYYFSFRELPMATATVLSFTAVMWTTALAGPVLGEVVRWRRWSATLVGFLGVLLIVRPGVLPVGIATIAAIASALCGAGLTLATKRLAGTETTGTIMLYVGIVTSSGAVPAAILHWSWLTPTLWLVLVGMAALGVCGMFLWITALRLADASLLSPVTYTRLVFAALAGVLLFDEAPDGWTIGGAVLIVASTLYITQREAYLLRTRSRPTV